MNELCRGNTGNTGYGETQLYIKYGEIAQNVAGNYSTAKVELWWYTPVWYSTSTGSDSWTISGSVNVSGSFSGSYNGGDTLLWSGYATIYHDAQGNGTLSLSASVNGYAVGGSCAGSVAMPQIPREAKIDGALVFTDEENPYFMFNNPGGFRIDAYLEFAGQTIMRTNIPNTGSYSFGLDGTERNKLRNACPNANSMIVRYVLRTNINGSYYYSWLDKTMTIVNGSPSFTDYEFKDVNANTVGMTTNNQNLIAAKSDLQVTISTTNKMVANKGATPVKYRLNCGSKSIEATYSDDNDVIMNLSSVDNGSITVTAIDSRGNTTPILKTTLITPYIEPRITKLSTIRKNGIDEIIDLVIEGTYDNTDFGLPNTLTKIEYKKSNVTDWTDITNKFNISDGVFKTKANSELTGFTLGTSYTLNFRVTDGNGNYYLSQVIFNSDIDNGTPAMAINIDKLITGFGKIPDRNLPAGSIDVAGIVNNVFPVGSIYMSAVDKNPSEYFGGIWIRWGAGRVPVGVDTTQSEFSTVEKTGGEKTHKLTLDELASHGHTVDFYVNSGLEGGYDKLLAYGSTTAPVYSHLGTNHAGGDKPHNNLQPYITCYMWKRTA